MHYHILTDDPRSEKELRKCFNEACERCSLSKGLGNKLGKGKDFRVDYNERPEGYDYDYYLKYGEKYKDDVVLFIKGTRLQKFYQIGKWYKDENNQKKKKSQMRKEIREYMKKKSESEE